VPQNDVYLPGFRSANVEVHEFRRGAGRSGIVLGVMPASGRRGVPAHGPCSRVRCAGQRTRVGNGSLFVLGVIRQVAGAFCAEDLYSRTHLAKKWLAVNRRPGVAQPTRVATEVNRPSRGSFRWYTNSDRRRRIGEPSRTWSPSGAACHGLDRSNPMAALSSVLAEITRLALALGGEAGRWRARRLGLLLTCHGALSRNRW